MDSHTHQTLSKSLFIVVVAVLVLLLIAPVAALPPRPPRPTHVTPTATAQSVTTSPVMDGGYIQLQLSGQFTGLQAIVQWEDGNGNWHNVSGWQNTLSQSIIKWWVAPADFGKGPFRWALYQDTPANIVATSASFYLPASDQLVTDVYISLTK